MRDKTIRTRTGVMTFSILFMALIFATMPLAAADYDLVIVNGRVMDPESGLDAVRNVGVRDGKIAAITRDAIKGKETIDARNHAVAPGFIDGHSHEGFEGAERRLPRETGTPAGPGVV
jgi:predicted amidohydrolase YtcJ